MKKLNKAGQAIQKGMAGIRQAIKRRMIAFVTLISSVIFLPGIAFAIDEIDPDAAMQNFLNWFFNILAFLGAILLGLGIYNVAVSTFSSHDTHQKMQGGSMIIGGILLLGARVVVGVMGIVI